MDACKEDYCTKYDRLTRIITTLNAFLTILMENIVTVNTKRIITSKHLSMNDMALLTLNTAEVLDGLFSVDTTVWDKSHIAI